MQNACYSPEGLSCVLRRGSLERIVADPGQGWLGVSTANPNGIAPALSEYNRSCN